MTEVPPWFRGPLPKNVVPLTPPPGRAVPTRTTSAGASSPPADVEPTHYKRSAFGTVLIVNPNRCMLCHRPKHRDTAHHEFLADEATVEHAHALGWPIPEGEPPSW